MRFVRLVALFAFFGTSTLGLVAQSPLTPEGLNAQFHSDPNLRGLEVAFLPPLFASSHAANLLLLHNGDLLCFWFSGSREGDSNVAIVMSRLPKDSDRWEKTILIDQEPAKSYQNPVPFEADNGEIWLFHSVQSAGKGQADAKIMKTISYNGGRTWSKPVDQFTKAGSFTRQRIARGQHGELLLPLFYSTSSGITRGADTNYSSVQVSADQGKSWHECLVPQSNGLVHMNIIQLAPNRYVSFFRSRYADHIFRSTSVDGCHWQSPVATILPNNNASIQAIVLRNGHIVMAFNNTSGHKGEHQLQTGARAPLSIGLSKDGGLSWSAIRDLEVRDSDSSSSLAGPQEYSYPSVQQLPNGKIIVAYTFRRFGIKAVELDEKWITEGGSEGEYKTPVK